MVVRVGRYGPYLQRGEDRASLAEDLAPDELTETRAQELLDAPSDDRVLGQDPDSGKDIWVRAGRFGPYVQLGEVTDGQPKPRTASLFATMTSTTLTFEQALELLSIPRTVGIDPETGEEIVAHNGRFGPYLKRGTDTRSLTTEEQILSIGLDEAKAVFAQPKTRRGRATTGPLRELGADPDTNLPVVVRDGRFGPYVTDGTVNASLRKGDNVEAITIERASELLAERRAAGPGTGRARGAKKAAKKATAKKVAAKKRAPAKRAASARPDTVDTAEF
jgi:DNA topoisomerase-1